MVIIYNLSGLVVGAASLGVGVLAVALTGKISLGLFLVAMIWLIFGRGSVNRETGEKRPAPALFFIPLFYLAFPALLLSLLAGFAEFRSGPRQSDTRVALLKADEQALDRSKLTGDQELAGVLFEAIKGQAHDDKMHVFAKTQDDRVLVLVKIPTLKELGEADRRRMLETLVGSLAAHRGSRGHHPFVGIKGRLVFGAIQTPAGTKVGSTVLDLPLLEFYGAIAEAKTGEGKAPAS